MRLRPRTKPSRGTLPPLRSAESTCNSGARPPQTPGPHSTAAHFPSASWRTSILAGGVIVLAGAAAYHNSFGGVFVYDDITSIVENETIRQLWPIERVLSPPRSGETVGGRPLLNLSLAINYALGGLNVWGYHAVNLAIHIMAALLMFGILRRTFMMPALRDRFGKAATALALLSALVWVVHPLQTESVTYIIQRAESLGGFFYLLTLYCVIRGTGAGTIPFFAAQNLTLPVAVVREKGDCPPSPPRPYAWVWYVGAVLACLLGTACKETLVTAPLVVLLYDRTFLAGSFREALRRRRGLYGGLAATWGLLAYLVLSTGLISRQAELGSPDPFSYACSQPAAILQYLRLCVWPSRLCISYEWPVASTLWEILPAAIAVGLLLAAIVWGLACRKAWGFPGAWFFLILAPTSSILPLNQLANEHRMYLSLAGVAVLVVPGAFALGDRWLPRPQKTGYGSAALRWATPVAILLAVLAILTWQTALRNSLYQSSVALWQDTLDKRPNNPVAHNNLGFALGSTGRTAQALEHFTEALRLNPDLPDAHNNLGFAMYSSGKSAEAIEHFHHALRIKPDFSKAHYNLALALANLGRATEAIQHYKEVLRLHPDYAEAHSNLGSALASLGKTEEAIEHYQEALRLDPDRAEVHYNLGNVVAAEGRTSEAIEHYREALRLKPHLARVHDNLGVVLAGLGRSAEAIEHYRQALQAEPASSDTHNNLGAALLQIGKTEEAIEQYHEALRLKPDFAMARLNLARLLASTSRTAEAIEQYDRLLHLLPNSIDGLNNLAWLLATHEPAEGGDPARAVQLAERASELSPPGNAQRLDALAAAYAAAGRFDDAVLNAERAVQLAESSGQTSLAKNIQSRLELYRAGRPYRESARDDAQRDGA